jgi:hypothetical protein
MSLTDLGAEIVKLLPPEAAHTATIRALKLRLGVPLNPPLADPVLETGTSQVRPETAIARRAGRRVRQELRRAGRDGEIRVRLCRMRYGYAVPRSRVIRNRACSASTKTGP